MELVRWKTKTSSTFSEIIWGKGATLPLQSKMGDIPVC